MVLLQKYIFEVSSYSWERETGKIPSAKGAIKRELVKNLLARNPGLNSTEIAKITQIGQGSIDHHLFYMLKWEEISAYTLRQHRKYYFPTSFTKDEIEWDFSLSL